MLSKPQFKKLLETQYWPILHSYSFRGYMLSTPGRTSISASAYNPWWYHYVLQALQAIRFAIFQQNPETVFSIFMPTYLPEGSYIIIYLKISQKRMDKQSRSCSKVHSTDPSSRYLPTFHGTVLSVRIHCRPRSSNSPFLIAIRKLLGYCLARLYTYKKSLARKLIQNDPVVVIYPLIVFRVLLDSWIWY
jgi:hypothetical protein